METADFKTTKPEVLCGGAIGVGRNFRREGLTSPYSLASGGRCGQAGNSNFGHLNNCQNARISPANLSLYAAGESTIGKGLRNKSQ